jgi:phage recombination protein Bet
MTTEVIVKERASPLIALGQRFDIEPTKLLDVLRGTVIKPDRNGKQASNEEVAAFCIVANQYRLNPFTREIHAFTSGDKGVVPIVGIDGWAHIVNECGQFDGCEFEEIADEKGNPIAVTCKMYVKGREHPVSVTERLSECKRNTPPWNTMPWRMLRHKAYMQAARYAFGLSGIYDEDEARDIAKFEAAKTVTAEAPKPLKKALPVAAQEPVAVEPVAEAAPDAKADSDDQALRNELLERIDAFRKARVVSFKRACKKLGVGADALEFEETAILQQLVDEVPMSAEVKNETASE